MLRGTTPKHIFSNIPVTYNTISQIWVTYSQSGKVICNKTISDIQLSTDSAHAGCCIATVSFTQADTLLFTQGQARAQLRVLLNDGTALASQEVAFSVGRILKNGTINQ